MGDRLVDGAEVFRTGDTTRRISLGRSECLALLGAAHLGRLVLSIECLPAARPVLLTLVENRVIAAVGPGPEVEALDRGDVVALEIDGKEPGGSGTWSVRVTGTAHRPRWDAEFTSLLAQSELAPLMAAETPMLELSTEVIDGERTTYVDPNRL